MEMNTFIRQVNDSKRNYIPYLFYLVLKTN